MKSMVIMVVAALTSTLSARESFTVTVTDPAGVAVSNAVVSVETAKRSILRLGAAADGHETWTAVTDENGQATVKFKTPDRTFHWGVSAKGYYDSDWYFAELDGEEQFDEQGLCSVTFYEHAKKAKLILWKRKNPRPLIFHRGYEVCLRMPENPGRYGFDLKKCDWTEPNGRGERADFFVVKDPAQGDVYSGRLEFENGGGAYIRKWEVNKSFRRIYHADTNATWLTSIPFKGCFVHSNVEPKPPILSYSEQMVVRSRVEVDEKTGETVANYSLINGRLYFGEKFICMEVFFNPDPGDTNLEYKDESFPEEHDTDEDEEDE